LLPRFLIFWRIAVVKKLLLTGAALALFATPGFAADLPMKAPAYVPQPVYDWSGFYIGGNAGWGWDTIKSLELPPGNGAFPAGTVFPTAHGSGWLGGVQAGYNYQIAPNFVIGIEGEYSWADITDTNISVSTTPRFLGLTSTTNTKLQDLALATGRMGYALNNWFLYGKGGLAWGDTTSSGVSTFANGTPEGTYNRFASHTGWVVGVGAEWGFAPNWSARIEYDHIAFDSRTTQTNSVTVAGVASTTFISAGDSVDLVRAGVNYRFNWGLPVAAKY
jgi:outer membrane immunogenic protein